MSRIGSKPIVLPKGVEVQLGVASFQVKGPVGSLSFQLHPSVCVEREGDVLHVKLTDKKSVEKTSRKHVRHPQELRAIWGMTRSRLSSLVQGVSVGFVRELELQGIGYRASVKGNALEFLLGFSHPVAMNLPQGVKAKVEKETRIILSSPDKEVLGEFTARIRAIRPPDVYQGKGVRYAGEQVRKKAGKSAAAKGAVAGAGGGGAGA